MGIGLGNGNANQWTSISGGASPGYSCSTGYSIAFDGATENGDTNPPLDNVPLLGTAGTGSFCISFWVKTPDTTGGGVNQRILHTTGSAYNWSIYFNTTGKLVINGVPWTSDACNFPFLNNTWYHVAYSAGRATFGRWVVNGAQSDTKDISAAVGLAFDTTGYTNIASNSSGAQDFEGNLTEIAIWSQAMNDAQLTELYTNTEGKCYGSDFSFSGSLTNYWPCFNPSGTFTNPLPDTVGGCNFTLANMDATNVSTDSPL